MASVFPFLLPVARQFRVRVSTRCLPLGPSRRHCLPHSGTVRSLRSCLSRRQRPHSPAGVHVLSFPAVQRPLCRRASLTTRSSEQATGVHVSFGSLSSLASPVACR